MKEDFNYSDERFADIQMLRYRLNGFEQLSLRKKLYIYYLSQATLCGRDITFDQFGRYNIRIRKMLEQIYLHYEGDRQCEEFKALEIFLKRVWFSNGIYHHYGCEKFVPGFTRRYLDEVIGSLGIKIFDSDEQKCEVYDVIFDPEVLPKRVNQADGVDLVQTSACNFYQDVTQLEAEQYYAALKSKVGNDCQPSFGLNSKLVREDGIVKEQVYAANGLYGKVIREIIVWLDRAAQVAENERQRELISLLIAYYRTGDLAIFDRYSIEWIAEQDGLVDFINGFIEVYGDPLGLKGSWEGIVEYKDIDATKRTRTISDNAQWFEDHSPVDKKFKKEEVKGVSAKVITGAIIAGDLYPATAIGINLPNSNWIRSVHGSKSVTIGNFTDAYNKAAHGNGFSDEFVYSEVEKGYLSNYGDLTGDLHTDLHECLGHGSGQLLPGVDPDALKAYGSTIEEARADLFGLYYLPDAKMRELGLTPHDDAYKAEYYSYMMNGLMTQLVRIELGNNVEEAHMRNRQLVAKWAFEKGAADKVTELVKKDGKTYVKVNDYEKLRELFGQLLNEIQRIKSEGDFEAARQMVETYAVKVDPELHKEVLARYEKLNLAPYKGFVNPVYTAETDSEGNITDVKISYEEGYAEQMLRYSKDYANLPYRN